MAKIARLIMSVRTSEQPKVDGFTADKCEYVLRQYSYQVVACEVVTSDEPEDESDILGDEWLGA